MCAEHARAVDAREPVAVLAIEPRLPRALAADEALRERVLGALFAALRELPRAGGLVAFQATDSIVALFSDLTLEEVRELGDALVTRSFGLTIPGVELPLGPAPCIGLAVADARQPHALETLLAVAVEGASVARARGGACCAHTELYALCAERIARDGAADLATLFPRTTAMGLVTPSTHEIVAPVQTARPRAAAHADSFVPRAPKETARQATPKVTQRAETPRPEPAPAATPTADEVPPPSPASAAASSPDPASSQQVELLERRVAKLVAQLEESERKLLALEHRKGLEPGVASVYREVQGVDADDERFTLKNELMEAILQANLELRDAIASQAGASA